MSPRDAWYSRPEEERCAVGGPGCLLFPSIRLFCHVEGAGLLVCSACHTAWRERIRQASAEASLMLRCPRCAAWEAPVSQVPVPLPRVPLAGEVAQVIDTAMHAEGLAIDVRARVLARLGHDASWLRNVHRTTEGPPELVWVGP